MRSCSNSRSVLAMASDDFHREAWSLAESAVAARVPGPKE